MTEPLRRVGIVGLGLIGGSLARDLIARGVSVIAHDRREAHLRALDDPALARVRLVPSVLDVAVAETVVIAVPVAAALPVLELLTPRLGPGHVVMDVGGTKAPIVAHAEALGIGDRFVGCHPLAGDHRSGWEASRAGLFAGAPVFLCRTPSATDAAFARTERFWQRLGATPVCVGAAEHDRRLAFTSHLPHLLATALALTLRKAGVARGELGPGGRDMTRLAAGSAELWTEIALQNGDALASAIDALEATLGGLRREIEARRATTIVDYLTRARDWC